MKWLPLAIYGLVLGISIAYAVLDTEIASDLAREYAVYSQTIKDGYWSYRGVHGPEGDTALVNSGLFTTLVPALIQRATGLNDVLLFKIFPAFFFALMPVFVYLVSRRYLDRRYSLLASFFVLSQFYFLYTEGHGRVNVGWGLFAGLVWALIDKRLVWGLVFAVALVFAHYGTTFYALFSLLFVVIYLALGNRKNWAHLRMAVIILIALEGTAYVWHFQIAQASGELSNDVIKATADSAAMAFDDNATAPSNNAELYWYQRNFYDLESREVVVQVAFGKTLGQMNTPQKIEFVLSWAIVGILSAGLAYALYRRQFNEVHAPLAIATYSFIILAVIIPALSVYYGIARVWFTAMPALAPAFALAVSRVCKDKYWWAPYLLVAVYAMCTSGAMHLLFGIDKRL